MAPGSGAKGGGGSYVSAAKLDFGVPANFRSVVSGVRGDTLDRAGAESHLQHVHLGLQGVQLDHIQALLKQACGLDIEEEEPSSPNFELVAVRPRNPQSGRHDIMMARVAKMCALTKEADLSLIHI